MARTQADWDRTSCVASLRARAAHRALPGRHPLLWHALRLLLLRGHLLLLRLLRRHAVHGGVRRARRVHARLTLPVCSWVVPHLGPHCAQPSDLSHEKLP